MSLLPDESHITRIAGALWSRAGKREAAVLVGAGFSLNAVPIGARLNRMPSWNDLSRAIIDGLLPGEALADVHARRLLEAQIGATSASIRAAQEFEATFGRDALDRLIQTTVPDRLFGPGEIHRALLQLPWADVLTTNWDTLLERGAEQLDEQVYEVVRTVQDIPTARAPRIVKLHGSLPTQRPFILTEEDFRTYPERFASFVNLARQVSMENALVLLGFSGDDPNFLFWSGWVRDQLGAHAPTIYLVGVLEMTSSRRKMLEGRHVQPIDLSHLPASVIGTGDGRHALATRWFLERLQLAEPYQRRRWPNLAAPPDPPPKLVAPRDDHRSPRREPHLPTSGVAGLDQVREVLTIWRRNRGLYPGWVVAPRVVRQQVWTVTTGWIGPLLDRLAEMPLEEAAKALYELNWRYELALVPVAFDLIEPLIDVASRLSALSHQLSVREMENLVALVFAILRHAREDGHEALFEHWASWLADHVDVQGDDGARLTYERCLFQRGRFDIDGLEASLSAWEEVGDSFWLVRKAGLLAELGQHEEADRVSRKALGEIRRKTAKGADDIWSWSREAYALLLRSTFLLSRTARREHRLDESAWRQHDERSALLGARGCDGKAEFFAFVAELRHEPTPLRETVERQPRFDVGMVGISHHIGAPANAVSRLVAFQAIRFQEETGLPTHVEDVSLSAQIIVPAALWLQDVAPVPAVTAFLQASRIRADASTERILSRRAVATLSLNQAEQVTKRLLRLAIAMISRLPSRKQHVSLPHVRLRVILEALSRTVTRAHSQSRAALDVAMAVARDPVIVKTHGLDDSIEVLISRALEVMDPGERQNCLPLVFQLPLAEGVGDDGEAWDPTCRIILSHCKTNWPAEAWSPVIEQLTQAASGETRRRAAVRRLSRLYFSGALDQVQRGLFADALWGLPGENGLPRDTGLPSSLLAQLPQPTGRPALEYLRQHVSHPAFSLRDGNNLEIASVVVEAHDELELRPDERLHLLARFKEWLLSLTPDDVDHGLASYGDILIANASRALAQFVELGYGVDGSREIVEEILKENRIARLHRAYPLLVAMGLKSEAEATRSIRDAILSAPEPDSGLAVVAVLGWTKMGAATPILTNLWESVGLAIVAQCLALVPALQAAGRGYRQHPDSVPRQVDSLMTQGLRMLLTDTRYSSWRHHRDRDSVRRWGAALAMSMQSKGRGEEDVYRAWLEEEASDPLGDIKWGFATAADLECAGQ